MKTLKTEREISVKPALWPQGGWCVFCLLKLSLKILAVILDEDGKNRFESDLINAKQNSFQSIYMSQNEEVTNRGSKVASPSGPVSTSSTIFNACKAFFRLKSSGA